MSPGCSVIGVEPAAGDDATRSFRTKTLQTVNNPKTVADGARTPSLGSLTFPLVLEHVSDMATVDDPTLLKTMFYLWERLKLVVEPTGALGAAAALEGATPHPRPARRRHPQRRERGSVAGGGDGCRTDEHVRRSTFGFGYVRRSRFDVRSVRR